MTIYLVQTYYSKPVAKAFTCKLTATAYRDEVAIIGAEVLKPSLVECELITNQFMEQILQPKELHETNTNSSL